MVAIAKRLGARLLALSGAAVALLLAFIVVNGSMSAFSASRTGASVDRTQRSRPGRSTSTTPP